MLSELNLKHIFKSLAHNFRLNNIEKTIFSILKYAKVCYE